MARQWMAGSIGGALLLGVVLLGCAGPPAGPNVDRVSRTGIEFFTFLQTRGSSIAEIRASLPTARVDTIFLVDPKTSNDELADFIRIDTSRYRFEIFLRVIVSRVNHQVYRYIVRGGWRGVKMGYRALANDELYDAIYLHTHPDDRRVLPLSLNDYLHAGAFPDVMTMVVGDEIALEFEIVAPSQDAFIVDADGDESVIERSRRKPRRNKHDVMRHQRDAEGVTFELDRIFREKVRSGHRRVSFRGPEGMLVTFDREVTLARRLDAAYFDADIPRPGVDSQ